MRALDCECGQHLEADDGELFERAREHVDRDRRTWASTSRSAA